MAPELDGKEIEGKIGDVGTYSVDVNEKGDVTVEAEISKDFGIGKVGSALKVETNIIKIAEAIAAKTSTTWDDQAVAVLKKLLGIE